MALQIVCIGARRQASGRRKVPEKSTAAATKMASE
jgi:hypothetical protein